MGGTVSQIREMEGQGAEPANRVGAPPQTQELTVSAVSTQDWEKTGKTNDMREGGVDRIHSAGALCILGRHTALIAFIRASLRQESPGHKSKSVLKQSAAVRGWRGKQSNKLRRLERRREEFWNLAETQWTAPAPPQNNNTKDILHKTNITNSQSLEDAQDGYTSNQSKLLQKGPRACPDPVSVALAHQQHQCIISISISSASLHQQD